jgi:hypothetical protein
MNITMVRGDNAAVVVGGKWNIEFFTLDNDDYLAASSPLLTITLPDGTTDEVDADFAASELPGMYLFSYTTTLPGRYVAVITATEMSPKYISAEALVVTADDDMPTADDVAVYLERSDLDQAMLVRVLEAEKAAQRARCRIPAAYPPDLREALLRRCARNHSMQNLVNTTDTEGGATFTPSNDPEIRRLEAPYRKVLLA